MKLLPAVLLLGLICCYADDISETTTNRNEGKKQMETATSLSVSNVARFFEIMEANIVNDVKMVVVSPDKSFKAIVFQRNCGAPCSFNRQIIVIKNSDELPKHDFPGHFFYAENHFGSKTDVLSQIKVDWVSTNGLRITYPSQLEVTTNSPKLPIKITYETFKAK
jgi:hypothetical protein